MPFKRRATRRKRRTTTGGRKRRTRAVMVVGKSHAPRRRRSVSGTHHSKPRRRKRRTGIMGSTGSSVKQIAWMAVGVGVGAFGTHIILRPIEHKLMEKWPMIGKFIAAGEVFLGGMIALKGKSAFTKSVGVGVLAGGVHGLMKQFKLNKEIPGIHGTDDYSTIKIPMNGTDMTSMVAGLLENTNRRARTSMVAGRDEQTRTSYVAETANTGYDMQNLNQPYIPLGAEF